MPKVVATSNATVTMSWGTFEEIVTRPSLFLTAFASKEAVYISNMMTAFGFGAFFSNAPLFQDTMGALHMEGNSTHGYRTKDIVLRFFYLKELDKDGKI